MHIYIYIHNAADVAEVNQLQDRAISSKFRDCEIIAQPDGRFFHMWLGGIILPKVWPSPYSADPENRRCPPLTCNGAKENHIVTMYADEVDSHRTHQ